MLASGEPVPENGHTDEEEEGQIELDGQDENQESEVADETEEVTGEETEQETGEETEQVTGEETGELDEEHRSENDENEEENPSGLVVVVVEEVEDDEEEDEEERRRRADKKGKQPMPDQGGLSITELNDEDEEDIHLDLAILKAMCDYKCSIRDPSYNQRLQYVKDSFPDLKISREDLEKKITALEKSFNDVRKEHGDDPEMARPIDREIFDLSMILWGPRWK